MATAGDGIDFTPDGDDGIDFKSDTPVLDAAEFQRRVGRAPSADELTQFKAHPENWSGAAGDGTTAGGMVNAAATGINSGLTTQLLGFPTDVAEQAKELGKAGAGYVASKVNGGHIPDWAEPDTDPEAVVGSSAWLAKQARKVPGASSVIDPYEHTPTTDVINQAAAMAAPSILEGGAVAADRMTARAARADAAAIAAHEPVPPTPAAAGFTPDEFAPKPPKPKITPKAGESPQDAAARQGIPTEPAEAPAAPAAPSAAPDAKGSPAPADVRDPNFFPPPDNPDLKTGMAGQEEQAARQAAVEKGAPTLPQVRDSAITNDYEAQGRDWTGKQAGDPVATAQIASEGQALHAEADRISSETGGQQGTGESADRVRGQAYQDWHDSTVDALNKHIKATYAAEDDAAKQIASPGSNLKGVLTDDSLIDNANAGAARSSVIALGKKMGVDLTDPNSTLNGYQIENLRKHANSVYGSAPRLAQAVKNAADADLPPGAYVQARKLQQLKSDMFDNRDGINQLGASTDIDPATGKPRPENRPVKAPDVMKKIEGFDPQQTAHIMRTMKRSASVLEALGDHDTAVKIGEKAHAAAQQVQSHFTNRWTEEASKGGGWNARRADQFLRGNQETLASVLSPEQMHQIRNVHNAANVLDLDKRYKGAFAQFNSGAGWLRQRAGRTAEGLITDMIPFGNTMGEISGASEWLRGKLGGKDKSTPPEGFTRPLGAKIPGQRGAVGHLNPPGVEHDYNPSTGHHEVQSPNGVTHANDHADGKSIIVDNTRTVPEGQGTGEGTLRLKKLADAAIERGGALHSDSSVSAAAQRTYGALAKAGYKVEMNPRATREANGTLIGDPVFRVTKPLLGGVKQAGEPVKLGQTAAFRRQAGAVGDLYDRTPAKDVWGNERAVKDRTQANEKRSSDPYNSGGGKATPMGARMFGGRQRGAISFGGDIRTPTHEVSTEKHGVVSQHASEELANKAANRINSMAGGKNVASVSPIEPRQSPMVNIGLHQGAEGQPGFRKMSKQEAVKALESQGVKVGKTSVLKPGENGPYEPTLVANVDRKLSEPEMQNVLAKTKQSAIPQRDVNGEGSISVAPGHEETAAKEGWDKYNSDYFRMHDARSATEHDAEAKGFNEVKPHLTDKEQADIENRSDSHRTAAIKNLLDTFHGSTPVEGVSAMALAGQAKKGWYKNAAKAINGVFGPDAPRFTALLAAMSPQTSVEMNFHNALHTFVNWDKAGRPTAPGAIKKIMEDSSLKNPDSESESESNVMDAWHQNGVRALTSADPEHENFQLSGPKVDSFHKNLRGHMNEVTNDSWNAIATNIDQKLFSGAYRKKEGDIFGRMGFKSPTYMGVSAKVRAAALQISKMTGEKWSPAEVQETMWSFVKTAFEHAKATGKSIPELIKSGELNDELIRGTSDFHTLFNAPEHRGFLDDSRFGSAARRVAAGEGEGSKPANASEARASAQDTLRPALLSEGQRLETARQARLANRKARIGNIQVPF